MNASQTRRTIIEIGACFAVAAVGYYEGRDVEIYLPWLWPLWLGVTALACFIFACKLGSARWWQISRVLAVVGALSRAASIGVRALNDALPNGWSGLGATAFYLLCARALYRLWSVDFRYWSRRATVTRE